MRLASFCTSCFHVFACLEVEKARQEIKCLEEQVCWELKGDVKVLAD